MKLHFTKTKAKTITLSLLAAFTIGAVNDQDKPIKIIQGKDTLIKSNRTWDADTIYFMKGKVYVTNNAELTIQPGTVIFGDTISKGTLIVTRGAKLHAVGTPSCPIVFTSSKATGRRNRGDWGGVILLGRAAVNTPTGTANIEGLPPSALTTFGGGTSPLNNDNSGELEFVRIEFAGVALSPNNEINGLTFGGVGKGTTIDFVQVSYSNDDSFEWFGGTVNCKHLIAFRGIDDDFDTDNGYNGNLQFGIGIRDPLVADISGSKAFESDNDANGSTNLPQTRAVFSNFTCVAGGDTTSNPNYQNGVHIRRNSHIFIYNSIVMGFPSGINIDGTLSQSNVTTDTLLEHNIVTCKYAPKYVITSSPSDNASVIDLLNSHANNRFFAGNAQVLLRNPYNFGNPDVRPLAGSPALTGASFNEPELSIPFFSKPKFIGALAISSTQNWATIWVNWKPTNTNYRQINSNCATALTAEALAPFQTEDAVAVKREASISPNPAHGSFNVDLRGFSGNVTIKVTNMNGASVYTKQTVASAKNIVNVNLNNAPAGIYFVTITNGTQSTTKKVNIVQ